MRLGILAGIHEDVVRLEQAVDVLRQIGCETVVCLGDIVGYSVPYYGFLKSRDAHRAIQLVRQHCRYVVAGNHDLYAVRRTSSQKEVFDYPSNWYALDRVARRQLAQGRVWLYDEELPAVLTPEDEVYLRALPEFLAVTIDSLGLMLTHYAHPDLVGDSTAFDPMEPENLARHLHFIEEHGCSIGLSGHDDWNGMVVATATERREVGFGIYALSREETVWIQAPWVANGTVANGVLVLDTTRRQIEAIPLNTPPHVVPHWAER
jgi:predicted phosphodiesterase